MAAGQPFRVWTSPGLRPAARSLARVLASRPAKLALTLGALALAAWLIRLQLQKVSLHAIISAMAATPPLALVASVLFTMASYAGLGVVEWCAFSLMGRRLPRLRTGFVGAQAAALSFAMGFGLASGVAVRLRLYAFARLVVLLSAATFLAGVITGAAALLVDPSLLVSGASWPPWAARALALPLIGAAALWFIVKAQAGEGEDRDPPGARVRAAALAGNLADWVFSAAALFILSSRDPSVFAVFLAVFCLGGLLGSAVGTPGGLGVLEATVLGLHTRAPIHETAAALILYRAIYFLGPLLLAASGLAARGLARWSGSRADA